MSTPFHLPAPSSLRFAPSDLSIPPLRVPAAVDWSPWPPPNANAVIRSNVWPAPTLHAITWAPPQPETLVTGPEQDATVTVTQRRLTSRLALMVAGGAAAAIAVAAAVSAFLT